MLFRSDALGPFGNPTSDSARTMVTTATTQALLVVFAPVDLAPARVDQVLDESTARMVRFTGCHPTGRFLG